MKTFSLSDVVVLLSPAWNKNFSSLENPFQNVNYCHLFAKPVDVINFVPFAYLHYNEIKARKFVIIKVIRKFDFPFIQRFFAFSKQILGNISRAKKASKTMSRRSLSFSLCLSRDAAKVWDIVFIRYLISNIWKSVLKLIEIVTRRSGTNSSRKNAFSFFTSRLFF